jgi:hypothetical protein
MRVPETDEQRADRLRKEANDRVREQGRGFKRVFARSQAGTPARGVLEGVLILLAIAGSALAATTWDAIFGDDPPSKVATASSDATETTRSQSSAGESTDAASTETDYTYGPYDTISPYTLEFGEIPGTYRLVFRGVKGACSADPEDNPPVDVQVSVLTTVVPPPSEDRSPLGTVRMSTEEGSWDAEVVSLDRGLDPEILQFREVAAEEKTTVFDDIQGAFVEDADGVHMNLHFSAAGCEVGYSGPRIGG